MTLAILISIRYYEAPAWVKSTIASADSIGRMITPVMLFVGMRIGMRTSWLASGYMLITGLLLIALGMVSSLLMYGVLIVSAYIMFAQPPQLMLQIYSKNYTSKDRGGRVSMMFSIALTVGIVFSYFLGKWLDVNIEFHRYQFQLIGVAAIISALFLLKIPSVPLTKEATGNPWKNVSLLWEDKLFGWMKIAYIILGIANGMVIPIRTEYMASPIYGVNASNLNITLIIIVIQGVSMIISTRIWGYIFDKFHFITTRLMINACFIGSYLSFFMTKSLWLMGVSIAVNGFAVAGGMIVWNLWVTKIVDKERVPAYMSAHIFYSGLKGIVAPYVGYLVLAMSSPRTLGITAAAMMFLSCWMFWHVRTNPRIR